MKRKVAALAMASGIALAVVAPTAAQAAPSENACHGQIVKAFNAGGDLTPGKLAQLLREAGADITAGDLNQGVQAFCKA